MKSPKKSDFDFLPVESQPDEPAKRPKGRKDRPKEEAPPEAPEAPKDKVKADKEPLWLTERNVVRMFKQYCTTADLKYGETATKVIRDFLKTQGIIV